jgi:hypothetical protein
MRFKTKISKKNTHKGAINRNKSTKNKLKYAQKIAHKNIKKIYIKTMIVLKKSAIFDNEIE